MNYTPLTNYRTVTINQTYGQNATILSFPKQAMVTFVGTIGDATVVDREFSRVGMFITGGQALYKWEVMADVGSAHEINAGLCFVGAGQSIIANGNNGGQVSISTMTGTFHIFEIN